MRRSNPDVWAIAVLMLVMGAVGAARVVAERAMPVERRILLLNGGLEAAAGRLAEQAGQAGARADERLRHADQLLQQRSRLAAERLAEATRRLEQRLQERVVDRIDRRMSELTR